MTYTVDVFLVNIESIHIQLYSHCTSTLIINGSDVPIELLAVQLYDPDLFLCMLGIV